MKRRRKTKARIPNYSNEDLARVGIARYRFPRSWAMDFTKLVEALEAQRKAADEEDLKDREFARE